MPLLVQVRMYSNTIKAKQRQSISSLMSFMPSEYSQRGCQPSECKISSTCHRTWPHPWAPRLAAGPVHDVSWTFPGGEGEKNQETEEIIPVFQLLVLKTVFHLHFLVQYHNICGDSRERRLNNSPGLVSSAAGNNSTGKNPAPVWISWGPECKSTAAGRASGCLLPHSYWSCKEK